MTNINVDFDVDQTWAYTDVHGERRRATYVEHVQRDLERLAQALHDEADRMGLCPTYEAVLEDIQNCIGPTTFRIGGRTTELTYNLTVRLPRNGGQNIAAALREAGIEVVRAEQSA